MSDYGTMQSRIADELDRSDLTSQIQNAIQDAIKFYQKDAFWFNDASDTFPTVDGTESYTIHTATASTTKFAEILSVTATLSGGTTYPLFRKTYEEIDAKQHNATTSKGHPLEYAIFSEDMRLYPVPNGVYTITISGTVELSALSADVDTNAWMVEAEPLIRHKATEIVNRNVVRDHMEADRHEREAFKWFSSLQDRTTQLLATGTPQRTRF